MRIVVLSDTHMPRRGRELPPRVFNELSRTDLVIHLGDFTRMEIAHTLEGFAPLRGVCGNNDTEEIAALFPITQRLELHGHTLRLLHGHLGGRTALAAARQISDADLVLFGHSHRAWKSEENGRLLFNPGSPTDPRWSPYRAFGLVELGEGFLDARIIPLH